jgi:hypothetical protein
MIPPVVLRLLSLAQTPVASIASHSLGLLTGLMSLGRHHAYLVVI